MALFGSFARGATRPQSDIDLLVLLANRSGSVYEDARERARLGSSVAPLLVDEFERSGHYHLPHIVPVDPGDFLRPAPVLLDLPETARILYDPHRALREALLRLARLLKTHGARRVAREGEAPYWELGTVLEAPA